MSRYSAAAWALATVVAASCAAPGPLPTRPPTPSVPPAVTERPTSTPTGSIDISLFTARIRAGSTGDGVVRGWKLYADGLIDAALFHGTMGTFFDAHLDWYVEYGDLVDEHVGLASYHQAMRDVLDDLAEGRSPARSIGRLESAIAGLTATPGG